MAAPAVLRIDIVADATKALKALDETGTAAGGIKSAWGSVGKVVGGAITGAAVVGFGKSTVDAATESAVATARLEQVFSSMGDTTGEAAKAAENYAGALSKKIGVDDEAVMAAQAQLATFGAVSDETARTAGVFDRATAAAADLAAAGFGTLDSNSVQLGKALQDPTQGLTALAKSGVTFTDAQKDQIKALQESGDLLGAQKIVLKAVEDQVSGTAEATATSQDKAKVAFGELQEQIGNKLLPVVSTLLDVFTKYSGVLIPLAAVVIGLMLATKAFAIAQELMNAVTVVATAIQWLWNASILANPLTWIIIAIVAVIAAMVLLFTKVDWFRGALESAWDAVVAAFNFLKDAAVAVFNWIRDNWPLLLAILTGPIGIAVLLITKNWDTIKDAAKAVVDWVVDRFSDLVGFFSRIGGTLAGIFSSIVDTIKSVMGAATDVYNWVVDKFNAIIDFFRGLISTASGVLGDIADAIKGPINAVIRAWNALEFKVPEVDVGPIHFGGQTIGLPNIPELARGGRVMSTGLAVVHEGETFSGVGRGAGGGPTTVNVTITHTGLGVDSPQLQRDVVNAIRRYVGRNGPVAGIAL